LLIIILYKQKEQKEQKKQKNKETTNNVFSGLQVTNS
jgi:hypothetical protein